jgi:hypothetical protein
LLGIKGFALGEIRMHILHGYGYSMLIIWRSLVVLRLDIRLAASQVRGVARLLFIAYPRCCSERDLVGGCIGNDLE